MTSLNLTSMSGTLGLQNSLDNDDVARKVVINKAVLLIHYPPSGRFPGYETCVLRVPQLLCSLTAARASKGNSQKIVYKTCKTT